MSYLEADQVRRPGVPEGPELDRVGGVGPEAADLDEQASRLEPVAARDGEGPALGGAAVDGDGQVARVGAEAPRRVERDVVVDKVDAQQLRAPGRDGDLVEPDGGAGPDVADLDPAREALAVGAGDLGGRAGQHGVGGGPRGIVVPGGRVGQLRRGDDVGEHEQLQLVAGEGGLVGARDGAEVGGGPDVAGGGGGADAQDVGEVEADGARVVAPVGEADDEAGAGQLAGPDVPLLLGVAADELGLAGEGVLVEGDDLAVGEDGVGRVRDEGRDGRGAEGQRGLVDGPHAHVELFLLDRQGVEADAVWNGGGLVRRAALEVAAARVDAVLEAEVVDVVAELLAAAGREQVRVPHEPAVGVAVPGRPPAVRRDGRVPGLGEPRVDQRVRVVLDDGLARVAVVVVVAVPPHLGRRRLVQRPGRGPAGEGRR
ncbi:hypothetical protein CTA1_5858 [Colletotrichum tanaceti]|uniref:Uncharacterized protein n=1 Tax=Colletotrichum tanaceti TaxID=1306861 RepID=A0A4U6X3S6_9PEZI|nr:hypothetical protein CTA1_5858 [Colletotrichum tanaceti]